MVLSGLMSQRMITRAAITLVSLLLLGTGRAQMASPVGSELGTMPEDFLPELKPILAASLKQSPDAIAREFEVLSQSLHVDEAQSQRLPHLSGNFNYGITESATKGSAHPERSSGLYYSAGASQAIWHWGELKNQVEAAKLADLAQKRLYAQFYRTLSNSIRKAYLALVVEKSALRQRRAGVEIVRRDLAIADSKFDSGVLSAGAREGERLRLRENEMDLRRSESEFETNRRRFSRLVGIKPLEENDVPDAIPDPKYSESRATIMTAGVMRDNARNSMEFEIWNLKIEEAKKNQKIVATRLLPKLDASIGYSLENNTYVNGNSVQQNAITRESAGIGGSWTIFDGFATRAAKQQASLARRSAEHQQSMEVARILESVQTLEKRLRSDGDQLELTAIKRGIAADNEKLASGQAEIGNIPANTVAAAKQAVLYADTRIYEARASFFADWCDFVAVAGDDPVLNNLPARYGPAKK